MPRQGWGVTGQNAQAIYERVGRCPDTSPPHPPLSSKIHETPFSVLLTVVLVLSVFQVLLAILEGPNETSPLNDEVQSEEDVKKSIHYIVVVLPIVTTIVLSVRNTLNSKNKNLSMLRAEVLPGVAALLGM